MRNGFVLAAEFAPLRVDGRIEVGRETTAHWKPREISMDFHNESVNTFSNVLWLQVKSLEQAWGITLQWQLNENWRKYCILFSHPSLPRMKHYKTLLRTTFKMHFPSQVIKYNLITPRVGVSCVKSYQKETPVPVHRLHTGVFIKPWIIQLIFSVGWEFLWSHWFIF